LIQSRHFAAFVHQKGKREVELFAEAGVAARVLGVHAEDLDSAGADGLPGIAKLAKLFGAAGGGVARIEDESHVMAAEGGERHGAAGIVQERELRSGRTDGEGIGEEPGEHYCIVIYGQLLRLRHKLQGILEADVGVLHVEAAGVIQFAVGQ
jgi:hypothetical protein